MSTMRLENLEKARFPRVGEFGIPEIMPETKYPGGEFIGVNYAMTAKDPAGKNVHFFVDDYQFQRFWNQPDRYVKILERFSAVCSPDFSLYTKMPKALQIYNHYRKHWLAAYWQNCGITVYPTIGWSDEESFGWCFDGEPKGGIVAVSSVGTQKTEAEKKLFLKGYDEMMKRLEPKWVIFHGLCPRECDWNTIKIDSQCDAVKRRVENGRTRK